MLDTSTWKEFRIGDLFAPYTGGDLILSELINGTIPVVSHTEKNNGISFYSSEINGQKLFDCKITISLADRGTFFAAVQTQNFYIGTRVKALVAKFATCNTNVLKFISIVINHENFRFQYGRNCTNGIADLVIKLPVDDCGEPNYQFMEDFIKSQNGDVSSIPDYFKNEGYDKACWYLDNIDVVRFENEYAGKKEEKDIKLLDRAFKNFKIESLFGGENIYKSASYSNEQVTDSVDNDYLCYVTRSDNNNGIMRYVVNDTETFEKGNCITIGDTTATCFYQEHDFVNGDHIIVLRADWLNKYVGQFIVTLLNFEKFRYPPFGRAFLMDCVKNTELQLPIKCNDDGMPFIDETKKYSVDGYVPDWQFMEDYIKSLPFSCKL